MADTSPSVVNLHFGANPPTVSTVSFDSDGCDLVFCRSPPALVQLVPPWSALAAFPDIRSRIETATVMIPRLRMLALLALGLWRMNKRGGNGPEPALEAAKTGLAKMKAVVAAAGLE